ncbi:hypothetical protein FEM48_Zijuj12G0202000 [Ziziphus jujuba var. spinosa]|uniref:Bromo domain-containing protein n=1 Tax=Ziziphus jujuba var. spinosa TaxID=714518 RepID=A0A978UFB5_ZIZJJ|nr:hypothetical protein FEM48_Zijuj12G0202000 [Ziziphus jujuba var. spinosa]
MALQKFVPSGDAPSVSMKPLSFSSKMHENNRLADMETNRDVEPDVDIDLREVYFLIMHFLSAGPFPRTFGQFWNELLEHQLLPRRFHAWYSRNGAHSGDENDDGMSFPLSYDMLVERYSHIEKDHLVKLLKQLILSIAPPSRGVGGGNISNAGDVPTLVGMGSFSLLNYDRDKGSNEMKRPPSYMRWPHMKADQVRGLSLREIGGGFARHHRAPSIRAACYAIAKPSTMVKAMKNTTRLRGHRNSVYCAIFDRSGRYVITGSDDRLVKIWSMEKAYCLASCRGHEGDITDLAVSSNNALVASSSNDCIIRVWRLPDGLPISTLRGHTGAVTAIAFNPKPSSVYNLLSSSDDGTCRIWDARNSQLSPQIYIPRPSDSAAGKNSGPSSSTVAQNHQIFCCAFNANGTVFVTGSSDTLARVWIASKPSSDDSNQPNHEIDVLSGHENDVNYVQFSGCAVASKFMTADTLKEENIPKFKNSWFTHDNIVTCSRDGSAIIWAPRSRRSHGKAGRWQRAYHLKVPPPPMPPQPPRGGPRQRILPTPRGVNMIVWSLDNRFVLAAIMDCRICVWNASDGSLVHSLTGHTESTYVLDVHPFNPRMAMSAGYDGKIIVWDIWEGKPIWKDDISRFKLVDGKFSPDGTSIILSDDVGQLYIVCPGKGQSQKDAKYDQFFLGDYRPLIQDTQGNALDQETQLTPYRRNLQDLLCDSGMIPYPEPYQSAYQQRRLGALGIEWRPTSLKLATGPDFSLDQEYQMLPLADLDVLIDPLPEFVDIMDWEPEHEMHSDDTDSEYNVTEDYSTGGEQGSLNSNSSADPGCSAEDSEIDDQMDGRRRSKRKKQKAEIEIMTSSGRRVKRRNLDECDGNSVRNNNVRMSRNGRKTSKRKSSTSKSLRPERAAARKALTLFSKITGTSTDGEDEDGLEGDTSESESNLQDSNIESDGSDKYLQNERRKHLKGKEISLDQSEDMSKPHGGHEIHLNGGNRRRLVLKLPLRDSSKSVVLESNMYKGDNQADLVGPSSKVPQGTIERNGNLVTSQESRCSPEVCSKIERTGVQLDSVGDHLNLSEGCKNGEIRWGGVRARTSKRLRLGEATPSDAFAGTSLCLDAHHQKENNVSACQKSVKDCGPNSSDIDNRNYGFKMDEVVIMDGKNMGGGTSKGLIDSGNSIEHLSFSEQRDYDKPSETIDMTASRSTSSAHDKSRTDLLHERNENLPLISTKLRLKRTLMDPKSPCKQEMKSLVENLDDGRCNSLYESALGKEQDSTVPDGDTNKRINSDRGNGGSLESDNQEEKNAMSTIQDSVESHSQKNKMYSAVYRRAKTHRGTINVDGDGDGKDESTSNINNNSLRVGDDIHEDSIDIARTTRSIGLKALTGSQKLVPDDKKLGQVHDSGYSFRSNQNSSMSRRQLLQEEWGSSSKVTVGLRSTRNRRGNYSTRETSPVDKRKSNKPSKKGSWLMLSTHEEGSRYIPQLGDEVAYLRQGHQEYIEQKGSRVSRDSREDPPWISMKGSIRAVEFCKVETLEYSSESGSGDSCCKMTLKFVDPSSSVFGKTFKLTLPEVTGFPDFLVEKTRYDAAIQRNWTHRDKCKVWWKNEDEEDGSWWDGRILSVKPKSLDFPDSPWERFTIQYKSDPPEMLQHSPWELFDVNTQWEQPHINDETKSKLLSAFAKLEQSGETPQDRYGVKKLKQLSQRPHFINRFPVPLSLVVIQLRLENNYYRSLEALKHDFMVMLSNAETYGSNSELMAKLRRLSDWFSRTLSSL